MIELAPARNPMPRRARTGVALASAIAAMLLTGGAALAGDSTKSAALPLADQIRPTPRLPTLLGIADVERYSEIFALQEKGLWAAADRRIRRLDDKLLLGHVLAQRYLHPTHYRSRFSELSGWLKAYADHPQARRIYGLALQRKPRDAKAPPPPRARFRTSRAHIEVTPERAPERVRAGERGVYRRIARYVKREHLTSAEKYLAQSSMRRAIGTQGVDRSLALVAAGWFRRGDNEKAYRIAASAAGRSGGAAPRALWWAGLSAFRLGRFEDAIGHLEKLAATPGQSDREEAAAAFWAARAALRGGHSERVGPLLERAARFERTFYGQIAAQVRGQDPAFDWRLPMVTASDIEAFARLSAGKRTLALIQVGEEGRAESELRTLRIGAPPDLLRTVIALSDAADMPGTALRAGRVLLRATGTRIDPALYPIPHWVPEGGYSMDRALVYALARQESGFNVRARSRAGARGLLQLMPATARFMAESRRSFRGRNRAKLYDPSVNLQLGQKYLDHLLTEDVVGGNLALMFAAYNAGPGNLAKWQRRVRHDSDPLVFMESIPARETRLFVQRVFENLWIYRARLGQDAPTLAALAAGRWPAYVSLDGARFGVAEER